MTAPTRDDYFNKDYADIEELKAQAEIVRAEIKELQDGEDASS